MTISWYGQSCFHLEGKDVSVLIDPFSKDLGLKTPRLNDNIFLLTHEHFDHNNLEGVSPEAFVIRGPGEYETKGIFVHGISSFHDNMEGKERGLNTIYVVNFEDMNICHLGDLGQTKLTEEQVEAIGNIDILMVPVGGNYTIDGQQAAEIVSQIEPKVIIPMHYKIDGLKVDLDDNKKFLKSVGLQPEKVDVFKINRKSLPQEEIKLVVFNY